MEEGRWRWWSSTTELRSSRPKSTPTPLSTPTTWLRDHWWVAFRSKNSFLNFSLLGEVPCRWGHSGSEADFNLQWLPTQQDHNVCLIEWGVAIVWNNKATICETAFYFLCRAVTKTQRSISNICHSRNKTRSCPSCPERNEHSCVLLFLHFLTSRRSGANSTPFSTLRGSNCFPLHLFATFCWVAKVHSSLLDSTQIDSVLSRPVLSAYLSHQFQQSRVVPIVFVCFTVLFVLLFYRSYFVGPTVGSSRFDKGGHCVTGGLVV